jgi:alpha-D-ribose 1-methylphosphonate 5-triphosphate synthase subunit PhnG
LSNFLAQQKVGRLPGGTGALQQAGEATASRSRAKTDRQQIAYSVEKGRGQVRFSPLLTDSCWTSGV